MSTPTKPNGTTRHVTHHRALHERVFGPDPMIKSSNTVKASRDSSGVYSLTVANSGGRPAARPGMFPFKIYKPSNFAKFSTGVLFNSVDGGYVTCNVDANNPTDFSASPPTVNPGTDAWRFWAVRSGEVEYRPLYNLNSSPGVPERGYSWICPVVTNTDGITAYPVTPQFPDVGPVGNYDADTTATVNPPIIIGPDTGGADGPAGYYQFAFWIQITPDTAADLPTFEIRARDCSLLNQSFVQSSQYVIPIGTVTNYPGYALIIDQMVFDHIFNRYPSAAGNFCAAGSWMNPRGSWDRVTPAFTPADLDQQVFYSGDTVFISGSDLSSGVLYSAYQFVSDTPYTWEDPAVSPRWNALWQIDVPA